jgi:DNA-binding IclR family transcriptional regulator
VVAAVGISGPVTRLCDARQHPRPELVEDVLAGARSISRVLGHGQDR